MDNTTDNTTETPRDALKPSTTQAAADTDSTAHRLAADVVAVARRLGVPHKNIDAVRKMIDGPYRPFFEEGPDAYVQLRAARKGTGAAAHHQLNFRAELFCPAGKHGQKMRRVLADALARQPQSAQRAFLSEMAGRFPSVSAAVDFDPARGLVKLWQFPGACTVDALAGLESSPRSLQRYLPFLKSHGFQRVFCTGVDLVKRSMNVYFDLREGGSAPNIRKIFEDLGLAPPTDEARLAYLAGYGSFTMTLRWDAAECERVCFYINPILSPIPGDLAAFMDACALPHSDGANVSAQHPQNSQFVSCSYGRDASSCYLKQESDWRGSYYELLGRVGEAGALPPASAS